MSAQPLLRAEPAHAEPQTEEFSGTASQLRVAETPQGVRTETRKPLSVIEYKPRKKVLSFILLCLVIMAATVATALGINVKVAKGQYELVQLQKQEQKLTQDNEARSSELFNKKSPQNLAARAAQLGMTASGSAATIDVDKKEIYGKATEAKKQGNDLAKGPHVKAPREPDYNERELARAQQELKAKQNTAQGAQAPAPTSPDAAGSEKADSPQSGEAEKGARDDAKGERGKVSDTPSKKGKAKEAAGDNKKNTKPFSGKDLNGGSIPGPQTSSDNAGD